MRPVAGEHAQRGEFAGQAAGGETVRAQGADPVRHLRRGDLRPRAHALPGEEPGALAEIALVGGDRVARKAALEFQVADEPVDGVGQRRGQSGGERRPGPFPARPRPLTPRGPAVIFSPGWDAFHGHRGKSQ